MSEKYSGPPLDGTTTHDSPGPELPKGGDFSHSA